MHATMQKTAQDMAKGFDAVTASIKEMQKAISKGTSRSGGIKDPIDEYVKQAKRNLSALREAYANVNKSVGIGDKDQEAYWRN